MDTKWKKSRAAAGFLAFLLGISMLLEGALYFGTALTSSGSRRWISDSFQADWRDTTEFQGFISARLVQLITMGAGGDVFGDINGYDGGDWGLRDTKVRSLHNVMKEDLNILYRVEREGKELYSNSDTLTSSTTAAQLPDGYGFLLQFDGAKVRAWRDGVELDIYGDGYYRYQNIDEPYQWYVPGYKNFTIDEAGSKVRVTMAVIDEPHIFIRGDYGNSGTKEYNELYYLKQNLQIYRETILAHAACMGVGGALFLVYILLRKDKQRADRLLARGTGRIWFEAKLVLAFLLVFFCMPRTQYLGDVWQDLVYSDTPQSTASGSTSAATYDPETGEWVSVEPVYEYGYSFEQAIGIGTAVTTLSESRGWLLREYLPQLADHAPGLLAVLSGLYLLIINDWRYNKKPWRHGVLGMLAARELEKPIQRRLVRRGILPLALGLLWMVSFVLFIWVFRDGAGRVAAWFALLIFSGLLMIVLAVFARRAQEMAVDLGALTDHLALLRAGQVDRPLSIPPGRDLCQAADDLNHIQQGLHQAVEERTRSERMKVELVTNVSHDLKTPLTSILSYTELLAQEPLNPPASEYVAILEEKAHRLRAMVQDVFEVSKAATGQLPVKLERLDLGRLLRQTLADMDQAIQNSGLVLRPSIPDEGIPITADSDRLYRVFQNLLSNALAYSLPGSRVYLTLTVEGEQARASVQNTSAAELKPGVDYTARFVRGDESRTDGGSGLGLSIADSFTQACGGVLEITTEADLFTATVIFPLAR
ncbi:Alkaline phosphatase synthesis sensor protein phoR [uncultured Clostridium sp.]|nr:Alkaline phosphatase synthesis sensor protein phoR [uncultured Clostridium sp.]